MELSTNNILFVEPFYGGSHKQLIDLLHEKTPGSKLITMSAKKWHWRARCSALILAGIIPQVNDTKILFCSSVVSLAELLGIRPDLNCLRKIVYFHENQFIYPVQKVKERDVQFAYNQITTCLAADVILFNSYFNRDSLLNNLSNILKFLPDYRPANLHSLIAPKCKVLYFPVYFPPFDQPIKKNSSILSIVWPHRWEHDKNPNGFLEVIIKLKKSGYNFTLSLLGGIFKDVPEIFNTAKECLGESLVRYGYVESREDYFDILKNSDVAVSTAIHEFFGVSMLECVHFGCYPLLPNRLVYPEIYPVECLYKNDDNLYKVLAEFCRNPELAVEKSQNLCLDTSKYSVETLLPFYLKELTI